MRERLIFSLCAATFFLCFLWWRPDFLPNTPYFAAFMLIIPLTLWGLLWIAGRTDGLRGWASNWLFLGSWGMFTGWGVLSIVWARVPNPSMDAAIQLVALAVTVALFTTSRVSVWAVVAGVTAGLGVSGLVAILQAAAQSPIGLSEIGEYSIRSGARLSVLVADGLRYLRPYGLTPHPNPLGGLLAAALPVTYTAFIVSRKAWLTASLLGVTLIGWFALLLTFSRSAWVGLAGGGVCWVGMSLLGKFKLSAGQITRMVLSLALIIGIGLLFIGLYPEFIFARTGLGDTQNEQRSLVDRVFFTEYTLEMIAKNPVFGVGIGMNDWEIAQAIVRDPRKPALIGYPVHNVPLLILAELGIVGIGLWGSAMIVAGWRIFRAVRNRADSIRDETLLTYALITGFVVLGGAGQFDYYMWRLFPYAVLWMGLLGCTLGQLSAVNDRIADS
jgi:O-antigen ligase